MSLISTLQSTSKVNVATLDQLRSAEATEDSHLNQKPDVVLILEYYNHGEDWDTEYKVCLLSSFRCYGVPIFK